MNPNDPNQGGNQPSGIGGGMPTGDQPAPAAPADQPAPYAPTDQPAPQPSPAPEPAPEPGTGGGSDQGGQNPPGGTPAM